MLHLPGVNAYAFWRPDVLGLVLLIAVLYLVLTGGRRAPDNAGEKMFSAALSPTDSEVASPRSGRELPPAGDKLTWRWRLAFFSGLFILYITMGPLATLAEQFSFTAYVLQMVLGSLILPWLLIFSLPPSLIQQLLSIRWMHRILATFTRPIPAMIVFNALLSATLVPWVLDALIRYNWLHVLAQNLIFLAAIFFWWPIVNPLPEFPPLTRGQRILYIAYSSNFMMPIIVLLFISTTSWYPLLASGAREIGLNPLQDQQMGALLMLLSMYIIYGSLAFREFVHHDESVWYD
ncbi:MAG: cytochrome c oxidase assembly protein [Alicyclobacillaceae bacterium]|jgi:putative membrane protein|nr:cytochrome c oxidase assembly protein [Alicyclobacillaceae bacterium]